MMALHKKSLCFLAQKLCTLRNTKSKGMTLLEILVALGIFAIMFVFISRTVQQNHRQAKKFKQDIQFKSSLSNTLDLIRQDFQGVGYFLDLNENLTIQFPIEKNKDDLLPSDDISDSKEDPQEKNQRLTLPVLFSPHLTFEGEQKKVDFISYSFSNLTLDRSSAQWLKIHYSIQNCNSPEEAKNKICLIRYANKYWNPMENRDPEETLTLLRDLESLKFSYSGTEDFLEGKWEEKWKLENSLPIQHFSTAYPQKPPFPSVIKMEIEKGGFEQVFVFSISSLYLKTWNPYNKAYSAFPKWDPPEKKPKRIKNK